MSGSYSTSSLGRKLTTIIVAVVVLAASLLVRDAPARTTIVLLGFVTMMLRDRIIRPFTAAGLALTASLASCTSQPVPTSVGIIYVANSPHAQGVDSSGDQDAKASSNPTLTVPVSPQAPGAVTPPVPAPQPPK